MTSRLKFLEGKEFFLLSGRVSLETKAMPSMVDVLLACERSGSALGLGEAEERGQLISSLRQSIREFSPESLDLTALSDHLGTSAFFFQGEKDALLQAAKEVLEKAETSQKRRPTQDYLHFDNYLTVQMWQGLAKRPNVRERAEYLSEWLFSVLKLRLPSENTFGQMTAVLVAFENHMPSSFNLHETLQIVKSTWRSISKRLETKEEKRSPLLLILPASFDSLSPEFQMEFQRNFKGVCFATEEEGLVSSRQISFLYTKVPLRRTHRMVRASDAGSNHSSWQLVTAKLASLEDYLRARPRGEEPLRNLQLFSPRGNRQEQTPRPEAGAHPLRLVAPSSIVEEQHRAIAAMGMPPSQLVLPAPSLVEEEKPEEKTMEVKPVEEKKEDKKSTEVKPVDEKEQDKKASNHSVEETVKSLEQFYVAKAEEQKRQQHLRRPAAAPKKRASTPKETASNKKGKTAEAATALGKEGGSKKKGPTSCSKVKKTSTKKCSNGGDYVNSSFSTKKFGECRVEFYAAKSYIRNKDKKSGKYRMIIGSCHKDHHKEICKLLVPYVKKDKSVDELLKLRQGIEKRLQS